MNVIALSASDTDLCTKIISYMKVSCKSSHRSKFDNITSWADEKGSEVTINDDVNDNTKVSKQCYTREPHKDAIDISKSSSHSSA